VTRYKAIILDLDGTTVPSRKDGMPSEKVKKAVSEAKRYVKVSIATGRPFYLAELVAKELQIDQPSVVDGGSEIINPLTHEILFKKVLPVSTQKQIYNLAKPFGYDVYTSQNQEADGRLSSISQITEDAGKVLIAGVPNKEAINILEELTAVPEIASHPASSWTKGDVIDIHITHQEATKKHAVEELLKLLNLASKDVIGVGDSHNDLPLLSSVGFKVAMGNAPEEIKKIADYVAPSLEEDGVADVIEKFILKHA